MTGNCLCRGVVRYMSGLTTGSGSEELRVSALTFEACPAQSGIEASATLGDGRPFGVGRFYVGRILFRCDSPLKADFVNIRRNLTTFDGDNYGAAGR